MKNSVILFVVICAVIAGAIIYIERPKPAPAPTAVQPPQSSEQEAAPKENSAPSQQPVATPAATESTPAQAPAAAPAPVANNTSSNDATNSIHKTVDALLAARREKQEMLLQLAKSGQLDDVIAELQKRAKDDPTNPEIPTTLGEALLNKVRAIHDAGGTDVNEMGILAMQADQQFNAALKTDPNNWEAQFVKYNSMYYWPADPQRDADIAQHLAGLIDQQDTMPYNPAFAQTYITLGNQYQKMGRMDEAIATWQLGLQKFPGDPSLQKKIAGAAK